MVHMIVLLCSMMSFFSDVQEFWSAHKAPDDSQMWMISDRQEFWNANELSHATKMSFVNSDGTLHRKNPKISQLLGKKVLIVIHGYNNSKEDVLPSYFTIKEKIAHLSKGPNGPIYDEVIGYVWPGFQSRTEYYHAKEHAEEVSKRVSSMIAQISSQAKQVDVMAHSMGNLIFLEAMNSPETVKEVTNFFSFGAAVDNESIEKGKEYYTSIKNCRNVYVAYSKEDDVLKYFYTLAELDNALGSTGIEDISKLPSHVQLVDCDNVIESHSEYFKSSQIFTFIQNRLLGIPPLPENAKRVKLLEDNEVVVLLPIN